MTRVEEYELCPTCLSKPETAENTRGGKRLDDERCCLTCRRVIVTWVFPSWLDRYIEEMRRRLDDEIFAELLRNAKDGTADDTATSAEKESKGGTITAVLGV